MATGTVTASYVWTGDANNLIQPTADRLNLTANPTVVFDFDYLTLLTLTGTDNEDGTGSMEIDVVDTDGAAVLSNHLIRLWISTTSIGAAAAVTGFAPSTGTETFEYLSEGDYDIISDENGVVVMDINNGGAGTVYVMAVINGKIYSTSLVITA